MKDIRKLISGVNKLEQQLQLDVANVTVELKPFPGDRDRAALETAWRNTSSSRRKLANCLNDALLQIKACKQTAGGNQRLLSNARRDLKAIQSRLKGWGHCKSIVSAQLLPDHYALATAQETQIMDQVVDLFLSSMHKVANPTAHEQEAEAIKHGCHRDIPLSMDKFCIMIGAAHRVCLALKRQRPLRFLDVGSGGGTKALAATTCFDICDGLECEISTVITGRRLLELLDAKQCNLMHGDALEFSNYGEYDVIYAYKPMTKAERMAEMEDRIIAQAKPGTVLLAPFGLFAGDLCSKGVQTLVKNIYITGMTKEEASEIGKTAEQLGLMVPGVEPKTPQAGYWTPLLEVSTRNGYFL